MMDLWLPPKPAIIRPAEADLRRDWRRPHAKEANFAPGWFPAGAMGGVPLTLAGQASANAQGTSGTAATIACPTVIAGDLIVLYNIVENGDGVTPTAVAPSGFTTARNDSVNPPGGRALCWYKIAAGTESGSTLTGMVSSADPLPTVNAILVATFRGSRPIASVSLQSAAGQATQSNPSAQVVTSGSGVAPLIVIAAATGTANLTGFSFSPSSDGNTTTSGSISTLQWKIYNSSPVDVTVDFGDRGTNYLQTFYLACS